MSFDKQKTEELLFDYFEGNLNESDKQKLMNTIHEHPELERDFASWAQSYAHKDERLHDYGLKQILTRKKPVPEYKFFISDVVFLSLILFLFFLKPVQNHSAKEEESNISSGYELVNREPTNTNETEIVKSTKDQKKKAALITKDKSTKATESTGQAKVLYSQPQPEIDSPEDTTFVTEEPFIKSSEDAVVDLSKEKFEASQPTILKKGDSKASKGKRIKRKVSLRPSPGFLPVNPNL